jgi:hypothetical protein
VLLIPFVRRGWRESPWWAQASAVGGVLYLVVQLRSNTWHGGGSFFGSRLTLETVVLSAPLLLRTWQCRIQRSDRLKGAFVGLVGVAVVLHGIGATIRSMDPVHAERMQVQIREICSEHPELLACQRENLTLLGFAEPRAPRLSLVTPSDGQRGAVGSGAGQAGADR